MEKKKSTSVLLAIMGVLIIVEIVTRLVMIQEFTFTSVGHLISLLFVALYGFWLYRIPHGNMLKYAMLIFAFFSIINASYFVLKGLTFSIPKILASAAVCYCAGRLNRIDQNKYLMPIIGLVFLGVSVYVANLRIMNQDYNAVALFSCFNFTINYLTLMIAYFVRYEEHKLAGIMDVPKQ